MGMMKIGKNPLFHTTFWGFLGFSKEKNGPQKTKLENLIYSTFCVFIKQKKKWLCEIL
jgi:hypothetical protein